MAADIQLNERLILVDRPQPTAALSQEKPSTGRVLHSYGERIRIVQEGEAPEGQVPSPQLLAEATAATRQPLSEVEALGAAAFQLRLSRSYIEAKSNRARPGEKWNLPEGGCGVISPPPAELAGLTAAAAPTSAYMEGSVAVGIIIVSGSTPALQFTAAERTKVVAEVQNGLTYYASTDPAAGLSFIYDIRTPQVNVQPNPSAPDPEALWRDPAMAALGFPASWAGVGQYVTQLRNNFKTRWAYCAFFTKYPLGWFAYAGIGGPRLVMQYSNDGWGPDNIDRVFAHETGHIFMCPDEYASSGCDCGGTWGRFGKPNTNCENCAPAGGISCIMKANDWSMCTVTPAHLGWVPARLFAKNSNKSMDVAGGSNANGAGLIQWQYHGGENQQFRPDAVGSGYFRLVAQHSGKVLDVSGASLANGAPIIQWDWHGGPNQLFRLEMLDDGFIRIIAKHSGKVIDVSGGSGADGASLIQWDWHGGANQRWLATAPMVAKHSGKVMDVSGASLANGAPLIQYDYHGKGNQIFRPEALGGGEYRFVAQHSGKVLDVSGASQANGAAVIQYDWHGGNNQRFRIQPLGDGHVRIVAKHSGKVIDVSGASTGNGAQLIQYDWHGGNNQRWIVPRWVAATTFVVQAAAA